MNSFKLFLKACTIGILLGTHFCVQAGTAKDNSCENIYSVKHKEFRIDASPSGLKTEFAFCKILFERGETSTGDNLGISYIELYKCDN